MKKEKWDKLKVNDYIELKRKLTNYVLNRRKKFARIRGELPTFKQICRRLGLTLDQVEQLCDDTEHCCVNVGMGVGNCYGGDLERYEWTVEILT